MSKIQRERNKRKGEITKERIIVNGRGTKQIKTKVDK
jgi:hypothetical protein